MCKPCRGGGIHYPIMFAVPLFFVWVVFLVLGGLVTSVAIAVPKQI